MSNFNNPFVVLAGRVTRDSDHNECRITWRAGITIDNEPVIRNMDYSEVLTPEKDDVDSCPKEKLHELSLLMVIQFEYTSARSIRRVFQ